MQNESGRSLLEMLGILAIIGVLSVGGIAGFKNAIEKNRANTIISEAQKRAVVVAGQIGFNNGTPSLADFSAHNTVSGGTFGDVVTTGLTGQFGIPVSGVKKRVCENILNTIGNNTAIRRLSSSSTPKTPMISCEDTNSFLIIYNNNLQGVENNVQYCSTHADCDECGTCNQTTHLCVGACESACNENDTCGENECVVCDEDTKTCQNKCVEVEYLESTGGPWINTELLSTENSQVDVTFSLSTTQTASSNNGAIFGGRNTQLQNTFTLFYIASATQQFFRFDYQGQRDVGIRDTDFPFDTERKFRFIANSSKATTTDLTTNQSKTITYSKAITFTTTPIILFAVNTNSDGNPSNVIAGTYFKGKIYEYRYSDGANLIHFVPVISPYGEPCMFDKISKKLFCNSGSGTFKTNLDE